MEQTQPQRIAYFDVLRILATFAVIVLHLSAQHWADTDVYSRAWQAFNLYDSAVRWAVPVFVMISGALFLSGSQSIGHILKKNVSRLVTAFIFWSALYGYCLVALSSLGVFRARPGYALFAVLLFAFTLFLGAVRPEGAEGR